MEKKNIIIYSIVALIVIALAGLFIAKANHKKAEQTPQAQTQNPTTPNQDNTNQQAAEQPVVAASKTCPAKGETVLQNIVNGKFQPTLDISNKVVTMQTNMGTFKVQLYDKDAPKTVENFVCLVQRGFYNGITFHRVAHGFVVQAGDPTGTGSGGESIYGGAFEDELYSDTPSYKAGYVKGVLAMANSGPNTNSSQFFIITGDGIDLPHNYTIFGKVISGLDVVEKIGAVPVTPQLGPEDGAPKTKITIIKATVN
jgi:cyclophilin family peptidyl-prolyl cis-trans isomerase